MSKDQSRIISEPCAADRSGRGPRGPRVPRSPNLVFGLNDLQSILNFSLNIFKVNKFVRPISVRECTHSVVK